MTLQIVVRVTHLLYKNMSGFHTFDASTLIALMSPKLELFHFKNGLCHAYKNDDKKGHCIGYTSGRVFL